MISTEDREIARRFKERLLQEGIPLVEMRVFGSRARGDFTQESDLDVFLLVEGLSPSTERRISRLAWEVGFDAARVISTVEYTPEQVDSSPLRQSPFLRSIRREGVTV